MRRIVLKQRSRPSPSLDETVIPLINIVFLLLIFFLAAGDLSGAISEGLMPPQSSIQQPSSLDGEWLGVQADGVLVWRGRLLSRKAFAHELASQHIGLPASLQLRVDAQATAGYLLPVLELLRERGVTEVKFLTLSRQSL